jgi:uncharacterized protein (TIRG00374 family)
MRARLSLLLRLLVAFAILGWIATKLPWRDELRWYTAKKVFEGHDGEIVEGDWKRDAIRFRFVERPELGPAWPADARAAAGEGNVVDAARRTGEAGYDWQPSMQRALGDMEVFGLALAMSLFLLAALLVSTRWWRLLAVAGCRTTWFNAMRLTFIGFTFNLVMPGMTGGDVVKGMIAAKENPGRRADAVVSVIIDRVIGLLALALVAVVMIPLAGEGFSSLLLPLVLLLIACLVGAFAYANRPLRRILRLTALAERLPLGDKLRSLDRAALLYLEHPGEVAIATVLSIANHVIVSLGVFCLARAVGVPAGHAGPLDFIVLTCVANLISALPLAPGGWGVGEFAYKWLFEKIHLSGALGVAVSVIFRLLTIVGLGLVGSLFLLLPGTRAEVRETRAEPGTGAPSPS